MRLAKRLEYKHYQLMITGLSGIISSGPNNCIHLVRRFLRWQRWKVAIKDNVVPSVTISEALSTITVTTSEELGSVTVTVSVELRSVMVTISEAIDMCHGNN